MNFGQKDVYKRQVCGLVLLNQTTAKVLCFMIPTSLKNYVVKATKASNLFHRLRLSFPEIRLWLI